MGGNQVYGPEYANFPAEMQNARTTTWDYITKNLTPTKSPLDLGYNPTDLSARTGQAYKELLGTLGTNGGPSLEGAMPTWGGMGDLSSTIRAGMNTGFLGDTSALWKAKTDLYSQNAKKAWDQAVQQNYLTGGRSGTGIANVLGDVTNQGQTQLRAEMAPYDYQNIQDAMNRRATFSSLGMTLTDMLNNQALGRLGATSAYTNQEEALRRAGLNAQYQEWLRQQPGYNQISQNLMAYAMNYPGQAGTPTVVPPWWQSLLAGGISAGGQIGSAAAMAPYLRAAGG